MITFVSAFLDLREDRAELRSVEESMRLFSLLVSTNINIHLFLSPEYESIYNEKIGERDNVTISLINLEDLDVYKTLKEVEDVRGEEIPLIPHRNTKKDSRNFLILMNAKTEFIRRTAETTLVLSSPPSHYAWIDFNICHVFKEENNNALTVSSAPFQKLKILSTSPLKERFLSFPGCWNLGYGSENLFSSINWRYCGGFFIGDTKTMLQFDDLYRKYWRLILEVHFVLTYEVNIWHYFELHYFKHHFTGEASENVSPEWWKGDHDNSIVNVPNSLFLFNQKNE